MVDHYIEDIFLPDILLEILSKNRVYENFELYSPENRILFEIWASYLDHVVWDFLKEIVKGVSDDIVNSYLRKRFSDKDVNERDPLWMVTNGMFDDVLRQEMKKIVKDSVETLTFDYMIEAQFNALLNRVLIPWEVERTILESIEEMAIRQVIDDYLEALTWEVCPVLVNGCVQAQKDKMEKDELKHMFDEFIDRCLMECAVLNLARLYEDEEENMLLREIEKKTERDSVKQRTDVAKMGLREVEEAIEKGTHPHFK